MKRKPPLQERVVFERPIVSANGMGGREVGWESVFEARANFRYLRGGEAVLAGRLQGQVTLVAMIWSHTAARDITSDWRMRDARAGTIYNVRSIIPSDDRAFLELTCESGVAT